MNTSESLRALHRANPRTRTDFAAVADAVRARLELEPVGRGLRRPLRIAFAGGLVAAVATSAAVLATTGSRGSEDAVAAVRKAAALTAASAQESGTAVVRITHDGRPWGGTTISWNGSDLALRADAPQRNGRAGSKLLLVDGMLYGIDPVDGGWVQLGPPESTDPYSGTTPTEILASVREDVGGTTARRFATGLRSLTTRTLGDGLHRHDRGRARRSGERLQGRPGAPGAPVRVRRARRGGEPTFALECVGARRRGRRRSPDHRPLGHLGVQRLLQRARRDAGPGCTGQRTRAAQDPVTCWGDGRAAP